ncbi:DNA replication licensing factor MCM7 [Senna tora]|uniref:DNA replication licensing factor MCM7 n=1 Tax=Senna tora TaxID=362788 RepID=A0A834WG48_9FABA|nr:DNA replication licensing factor MCM7 [Senna tora]
MPEPTEAFTDDDHDILMTQRSDEGVEGADSSDLNQKMPSEIKPSPSTISSSCIELCMEVVELPGLEEECGGGSAISRSCIELCMEVVELPCLGEECGGESTISCSCIELCMEVVELPCLGEECGGGGALLKRLLRRFIV